MHNLVNQFFSMQEKLGDLATFCKRHSLSLSTLKSWKRTANKVASVETLDKALNAIGYELKIVLKEDAFK